MLTKYRDAAKLAVLDVPFDPTDPHTLSPAQIAERAGLTRPVEDWQRNQESRRAHFEKLQQRAHYAVQRAVACGELPPAKDQACVHCGEPARVYEHRDYKKPLDVVPACQSCNLTLGAAAGGDDERGQWHTYADRRSDITTELPELLETRKRSRRYDW